jgi:CubicO group peptidase (beta-lactamase class C family)
VTNQVEQQTVRDVASYWASLLAFSRRYLRVPGIQAAVYRDSEIVLSGAYGCADVEAGAALTEEHLFRIASQSKTDTAIAILQLAERGKLRLDDAASAHVPELAGSPAGEAIVRDLLRPPA